MSDKTLRGSRKDGSIKKSFREKGKLKLQGHEF
jgi:hypothetical protein